MLCLMASYEVLLCEHGIVLSYGEVFRFVVEVVLAGHQVATCGVSELRSLFLFVSVGVSELRSPFLFVLVARYFYQYYTFDNYRLKRHLLPRFDLI